MIRYLKIYLPFAVILLSTVGCTIVVPSTPIAQVKDESQVTRAAMSEGRTFVGSMNRSQEAFHLEKDRFAESLSELDSAFPTENKNYIYGSKLLTPTRVQNFATSKNDSLTAYVAGIISTKVKDENTVLATLCQSDQASKMAPPEMIFKEGEAPICPQGFHKI